ERLGIHEVEGVPVAVEVLDAALLDPGPRPARAGLEGAFHDVAAAHVLQLHADLCRSARHLDVGPVEDLHELPVELDNDPLLDVAGGDHCPTTMRSRLDPLKRRSPPSPSR